MKRLVCIALIWALLATSATAERVKLLNFSGKHCPPCRQMEPILDELQQLGYEVQTIMFDERPDLVRQYGIDATPTFVVLDDGVEVARHKGATTQSRLVGLLSRGGRRQAGPFGIQDPAGGNYGTPDPSTCRLYSPSGQYFGSGTLIDKDANSGLVVSAGHVVPRAGVPVRGMFPSGESFSGKVVCRDCDLTLEKSATFRGAVDLAYIVLDASPRAPTKALAGDGPRPGDMLTLAGYGGDGRYRSVAGKMLRTLPSSRGGEPVFLVGAAIRHGDSGGPVMTSSGHLAGVISETNHKDQTSATYWGQVKNTASAAHLGPSVTFASAVDAAGDRRRRSKEPGDMYPLPPAPGYDADNAPLRRDKEPESVSSATATVIRGEISRLRGDLQRLQAKVNELESVGRDALRKAGATEEQIDKWKQQVDQATAQAGNGWQSQYRDLAGKFEQYNSTWNNFQSGLEGRIQETARKTVLGIAAEKSWGAIKGTVHTVREYTPRWVQVVLWIAVSIAVLALAAVFGLSFIVLRGGRRVVKLGKVVARVIPGKWDDRLWEYADKGLENLEEMAQRRRDAGFSVGGQLQATRENLGQAVGDAVDFGRGVVQDVTGGGGIMDDLQALASYGHSVLDSLHQRIHGKRPQSPAPPPAAAAPPPPAPAAKPQPAAQATAKPEETSG